MKKIFVIACMMLMSTAMFAQAGKFGVGANVLYGFKSGWSNLGFGAKAQYEFVENFRAEAEFDYFLKKDEVSNYAAFLNFHYLIPVAENFKVYPILGAGLLGSSSDGHTESAFGFGGGAGAEYQLSDNLKLDAAFRYVYGKKDGVKYDMSIVNVGIVYQF